MASTSYPSPLNSSMYLGDRCCEMGSSRLSLPVSARRNTDAATNVLVTLATRIGVSTSSGSDPSSSNVPNAAPPVYSGEITQIRWPGELGYFATASVNHAVSDASSSAAAVAGVSTRVSGGDGVVAVSLALGGGEGLADGSEEHATREASSATEPAASARRVRTIIAGTVLRLRWWWSWRVLSDRRVVTGCFDRLVEHAPRLIARHRLADVSALNDSWVRRFADVARPIRGRGCCDESGRWPSRRPTAFS